MVIIPKEENDMSYNAKTLFVACALMFSLGLYGCSQKVPENDISSEQRLIPNEMISIYDANDNLLVNIEHFGSITQTDKGFIYSKLATGSSSENYVMDYFYYNFSTKEHQKLGTIEKWVYEASYDSFSYNNHVYMLITTGDDYNFDETESYLYDINLTEKSMSSHLLENAGSPYNSMSLFNDKIYIVSPGRELCYVNSYDIQTGSLTEIQKYTFDSETNSGETIRHISADKDFIYLLRLRMSNEVEAIVYIDIFDSKFSLIHSLDVTDDITANTLASESKNNEARQLVSHFEVSNTFVYYENFSISRALFEIPNIRLEKSDNVQSRQIFEASPDLYKAVSTSSNDNLSIFYEAYHNKIFILDAETLTIKESSFFIEEPNYCITYMTHNSQGDVLLFLDYINANASETFPRKIYCVNISEFD